MICVREMFEDGSYIGLHDGGGRFAGKGQDIVDGEGGGAPVASEEGDGRVRNTRVLTDVHPYLFEEGSGIPVEGFVKGYACMASFALDDPSGRSGCFRAQRVGS
jgi:hypothetical protein